MQGLGTLWQFAFLSQKLSFCCNLCCIEKKPGLATWQITFDNRLSVLFNSFLNSSMNPGNISGACIKSPFAHVFLATTKVDKPFKGPYVTGRHSDWVPRADLWNISAIINFQWAATVSVVYGEALVLGQCPGSKSLLGDLLVSVPDWDWVPVCMTQSKESCLTTWWTTSIEFRSYQETNCCWKT